MFVPGSGHTFSPARLRAWGRKSTEGVNWCGLCCYYGHLRAQIPLLCPVLGWGLGSQYSHSILIALYLLCVPLPLKHLSPFFFFALLHGNWPSLGACWLGGEAVYPLAPSQSQAGPVSLGGRMGLSQWPSRSRMFSCPQLQWRGFSFLPPPTINGFSPISWGQQGFFPLFCSLQLLFASGRVRVGLHLHLLPWPCPCPSLHPEGGSLWSPTVCLIFAFFYEGPMEVCREESACGVISPCLQFSALLILPLAILQSLSRIPLPHVPGWSAFLPAFSCGWLVSCPVSLEAPAFLQR